MAGQTERASMPNAILFHDKMCSANQCAIITTFSLSFKHLNNTFLKTNSNAEKDLQYFNGILCCLPSRNRTKLPPFGPYLLHEKQINHHIIPMLFTRAQQPWMDDDGKLVMVQ